LGGALPGVESIVSGGDIILNEYEKVGKRPELSPLWIDWESDWDHSSEWQVLPVYFSRGMAEHRFGQGSSWESLVIPLSMLWPSVWSLVFENMEPEDVKLIAFSKLKANQELKPHQHANPGRKIFHMAVDVPEGDVGISTSSGDKLWTKPKEWITFDDNEIHSAWNNTEEDRVIFYLDYKA
jgi:hypothetical protein